MIKRAARPHVFLDQPLLNIWLKPVQRTIVIDYILCPECEARLGLVERYIANNFYNRYTDPNSASSFLKSAESNPAMMGRMRLNLVDVCVMHLFAYSILWRVSIAAEYYPNFILSPEIKEKLRRQLDMCIAYDWSDIVPTAQHLNNKYQDIYYDINISLDYPSPSKNWLAVADFTPGGNPAFIAANDLHFHFYIGRPANWYTLFNSEAKVALVNLLPTNQWDRVIRSIAKAYRK